MKRQEITTALATRSPDDLWDALLSHAQTLQPFWAGAVSVFAARTMLPDEKRDVYLNAISSAFDKMDKWRRGTAKNVKSHRKEIDSAISYLRNKAIEVPNRRLRFAPSARNAASALRGCLTVSAHGYRDEQLPELVACNIYDVAAVRTLFPFDFGNLMIFHPEHDGELEGDVLDVALQRASRKLGIKEAVNTLVNEANRIWETFDRPSPLLCTEGYWTAEGDDADAQLRSAAIAAFHGRN